MTQFNQSFDREYENLPIKKLKWIRKQYRDARNKYWLRPQSKHGTIKYHEYGDRIASINRVIAIKIIAK